MNKIVKNTLILTAITVVAGLLLGVVYGVTKDPIAKAQEEAKQEAFRSVLSDAETFESDTEFDADAASARVLRAVLAAVFAVSEREAAAAAPGGAAGSPDAAVGRRPVAGRARSRAPEPLYAGGRAVCAGAFGQRAAALRRNAGLRRPGSPCAVRPAPRPDARARGPDPHAAGRLRL